MRFRHHYNWLRFGETGGSTPLLPQGNPKPVLSWTESTIVNRQPTFGHFYLKEPRKSYLKTRRMSRINIWKGYYVESVTSKVR